MPGRLNAANLLSCLKPRNVAEDYVNFVTETAVPRAMNSREVEVASPCDQSIVMSFTVLEILS